MRSPPSGLRSRSWLSRASAAPRRWIATLAVLCAAGCERAAPTSSSSSGSSQASSHAAQPWFRESAAESGIEFRHDSGHRGDRFLIPETVAGGAAMIDIDNDGWLDLYLVQSGELDAIPSSRPGNRLYHNRGDGTFADITSDCGAEDRRYGMGVAAGDYDNDGFADLYVTNVGRNTLLRNNGDRTFTDVTDRAGVGDMGMGSSAAFADYDRDGHLDLYVCNYLNWTPESELDCFNGMGGRDYCSPQNYSAPARHVLYHNRGDGTFDDVSRQSGIASEAGTGLGVVCTDFNADGWIDIFVANDGMANMLWQNQGDDTFVNVAAFAGCAVDDEGAPKAGMGTDSADINDDGRPDLIVGNLRGQSDSLYVNEGEFFTDATARSGLRVKTREFTRFGLAWRDFDNDGCLDLFEVNGRVMQQPHVFGPDPYAEPNMLLRGKGGAVFEEVAPRGGIDPLLIATSRAAAFGDIDNDGGIDVLVINRDGPAHLLRNVVPQRGHWLILKVLDEHGRDAFGAVVSAMVAGRRVIREVRSAFSYCAANDPRVHFGLGNQTSVGGVSVRWSDGEIEDFGDLQANHVAVLRRRSGR